MTEQSKRILVVDDNEMNTDLLKRRLERRGFLVVAALSGKEALRILDQQRIDMVLLDVMMPEMNGVQVLQAIRAHEVTDDAARDHDDGEVGQRRYRRSARQRRQ